MRTAGRATPSFATGLSLALISGTLASMPVSAQSDEATRNTELTATYLEPVVVTAQKRPEKLNDVPLSVSAYGGKMLQELGITNTADLPLVSPSLTFSQSANARGEGFRIRGVGTSIFSDTIEQSVGFVVDGVPLARSGQAIGEMLDIDRIEVLRGPQGMLFGKNASAGLVSITTRRPDLGAKTFEADVSKATGNETKEHLVGNLPLGDASALRLAYGATRADGYVRNTVRNEDLNNRDEQAYRLRWLAFPSPDLEINVVADGDSKRSLCCAWTARTAPAASPFGLLNAQAGIVPGPTNLQIAAGGQFYQNADTHGISVGLDYDMQWATLTSITAYRGWKNADNNDADLLPINVLDRNRGSSDLSQRSQELRLTSPSDRNIEWVAGLYWSDQENRADNEQAGTLGQSLPAGAILGTAFTSLTTNRSTAVFGQGSLKVTERFKLIAGGRYTDETLGLFLNQFKSADALASIPGRFVGTVAGDVRKTNVSWRFTGQFDATHGLMAYATAARGFKGAGVNTVNLPAPVFEVVQPEIPTTLEAGLRSTMFGGTTQIFATAFKTRFKDFQAQVFDQNVSPFRFRVTNAGQLDTWGIELEFVSRPLRGLTLSGAATWLDATYGEFKNIPCYPGQPVLPYGTLCTSPRDCIATSATPGTVAVADGTGNALAGAPKTKFNLAARYETRMLSHVGFVQADYFRIGKVSFSPAGDPALVRDSYGLLGGSLGIGAQNGAWQLALFGRNLTDRHYVGDLIPQPVLGGAGVYAQFPSPGARRTIGVMASMKME